MKRPWSRPSPADTRESLAGAVERVTFHNETNGFCVLRVKIRGHRDLVTLIGHAPSVSPGEFIHASGNWTNDPKHGRQFRAAHLQVTKPTTVEGIEKYLGSGMVRGIGPHYAGKLVRAFGEKVFDVIEQEAVRLREIPGIGPIRARRITESWASQKVIRDIMIFLHAHGVSTARSVRIYKTYGADAVALISENPYRLARDIRGIGFLSADTIAGKLGIEKTAEIRARAGISYALAEAASDGHCGLPRDELLALAEKLLDIPRPLIETALEVELRGEEVVQDSAGGRPCVFLRGLYRAERNIGSRLRALLRNLPPWPSIDPLRAIPWVEGKLDVQLAPSQRKAVELALRSKVLVITGGPGVGKTTLVNAILRILRTKGVRVALCAPTGRAAKRLSESTGLEAKTIHRLLEFNPRSGGFRHDASNPLACDLLVLDEASMVDVSLAHTLLQAIPDAAAAVIVGDVDQLPSVGPGQVLADVIESGAVPVVRLTEVFRQAAASRIIVNAHRINEGRLPEFDPSDGTENDFYFVEAEEPEDAVRKLLHIVAERIPARFGLHPIREVQVLCPMNRGGLGARSLNLALQEVLNPGAEPRLTRFGWTFARGDKVMQVENDYDKEVYNGDLGFVTAIDSEQQEMRIEFDGRPVVYGWDELDQVALAYATSIHKSQGSEYPAVVIPVTTQHYPMLRRNLIYTGVTRGKKLVVLIGQRKAVAIAVRGRQTLRRCSKLKEWLIA